MALIDDWRWMIAEEAGMYTILIGERGHEMGHIIGRMIGMCAAVRTAVREAQEEYSTRGWWIVRDDQGVNVAEGKTWGKG